MDYPKLAHVPALIALLIAPTWLTAQEVTIKHQGLTLNASLEHTDADEHIILITHGALAHRGMELISGLQERFGERGIGTLAINLSLGVNDRHGMYDCSIPHRHRNEDALEEIAAWLDWLERQGIKRVTLLGHSRGGAQTALFMATHNDARVQAAILMAPATLENNTAQRYQQQYKAPLGPLLEQAQARVEHGQGASLIEHANLMGCRDTAVSAESLVSYYGPKAQTDTVRLLRNLTKPALVVIGSDDDIVPDLERKLAPLPENSKTRRVVIDGAGHFFRDLNADDAVDAMMAFLASVGG